MSGTENQITEDYLTCDLTRSKTCEINETGNCFTCEIAKKYIQKKVHDKFSGGLKYKITRTEKLGAVTAVEYNDTRTGKDLRLIASVIEGFAITTLTDIKAGRLLKPSQNP